MRHVWLGGFTPGQRCRIVIAMSGYGDFSLFYDRLTENVDYDALCEYICNLLAVHGADKGILLDLACGTGTLALKLSEKGYEVIGVDESPVMLMEAQDKLREKGENILFLCQSMQQLDLYGTVDACICTLDGINHLTDEAQVKEVFGRVSLFMNPGGVFIFDVNTVYKHREVLGNNTFVYDLDDVYCVWQNTLDEKTDTVEMSIDVFEIGDDDLYYRTEDSITERAYSECVLRAMLEQSGFDIKNVYAWMTENGADSKTEKAVYVCVKK